MQTLEIPEQFWQDNVIFSFIKLIKRIGNLFISLKIISLVIKLRKKEFSKQEEEFIVLRDKEVKALGLFESGFLIKVFFIEILDMQGLAMTRSFGDNISKSVGVTHKPEIIRVKID